MEGLADTSPDEIGGIGHAEAGKTTVVARLPPEMVVQRGERLVLAVDPRRVHFFDLDKGRALRG